MLRPAANAAAHAGKEILDLPAPGKTIGHTGAVNGAM